MGGVEQDAEAAEAGEREGGGQRIKVFECVVSSLSEAVYVFESRFFPQLAQPRVVCHDKQ